MELFDNKVELNHFYVIFDNIFFLQKNNKKYDAYDI